MSVGSGECRLLGKILISSMSHLSSLFICLSVFLRVNVNRDSNPGQDESCKILCWSVSDGTSRNFSFDKAT